MAKYRVLNPRDIPKGRYIIRFKKGDEEQRYFEGDEFEPPKGFDLERFVKGGFVEPVSAAKKVTKDG